MALTQVSSEVLGNLSQLSVVGNVTTYGYYIGDGGLLSNINTAAVLTIGNLNSLEVAGLTTLHGTLFANSGIKSDNKTSGAIVIPDQGGLAVNGNIRTTAIYADNYFFGNGTVFSSGGGGSQTTFESLNKNINSYPFVVNYSGGLIANLFYTVPGSGYTITKRINYNLYNQIANIVISGSALGTAIFTKNITYIGNIASGASYTVT
jgi:hypothetical protein